MSRSLFLVTLILNVHWIRSKSIKENIINQLASSNKGYLSSGKAKSLFLTNAIRCYSAPFIKYIFDNDTFWEPLQNQNAIKYGQLAFAIFLLCKVVTAF